LKQHKLYANFRKCHFLLKRMEFLGHQGGKEHSFGVIYDAKYFLGHLWYGP
jgi:hypothetical protein